MNYRNGLWHLILDPVMKQSICLREELNILINSPPHLINIHEVITTYKHTFFSIFKLCHAYKSNLTLHPTRIRKCRNTHLYIRQHIYSSTLLLTTHVTSTVIFYQFTLTLNEVKNKWLPPLILDLGGIVLTLFLVRLYTSTFKHYLGRCICR